MRVSPRITGLYHTLSELSHSLWHIPNPKVQLLTPANISLHRISPIVWTNGQENNCFIVPPFAETELTRLDMPTFVTDNKNQPKVSVHPRTAAAPQIQAASNSPKSFCTRIEISADLLNPSPDALAQIRVRSKISDESILIKCLVLIHSRRPRGCVISTDWTFFFQEYLPYPHGAERLYRG